MRNNDDSDLKGTERREPPSFAPPIILDRLLNTLEPPSSPELPPKTKTSPPVLQTLPPKTKIPPAIAAQRDAAPDASKPVPPMGPPKTPPPQIMPVSEESNQTLPPPENTLRNVSSPEEHDSLSNEKQAVYPEQAPAAPDKELPPLSLPDFPVAPTPLRKRPLMIVGLILVILLNIVLAAFIMLMFRERAAWQQAPTPQPPVTLITEAPSPTIPSAPDTVFDEAAPDEDDLGVEPEEPPPRIVEQPAAANVLHIRKLVLCRSVSGFGHYEPIPNTPLRPNHFPHIQAYVEIAHPKPEQREDGRYVYRMTKTLKVYRSDIGPTEPVMDTALSLVMGGYSPRSDFHSAQPLQTSRRIQPGEYVLVVSITDQISGETTTEDISFLILGP